MKTHIQQLLLTLVIVIDFIANFILPKTAVIVIFTRLYLLKLFLVTLLIVNLLLLLLHICWKIVGALKKIITTEISSLLDIRFNSFHLINVCLIKTFPISSALLLSLWFYKLPLYKWPIIKPAIISLLIFDQIAFVAITAARSSYSIYDSESTGSFNFYRY